MEQPHQVVLRVAWDEEVDVAYLSLTGNSSSRGVGKTIPIIDRTQQLYGTIDLSGDGELLGIELIGARRMLPGLTRKGQGSDRSDE
ncbi:DUF2283 domain-containing protein [Pseudonocardia sp. DSM 110487]|uniref:DUF2283 domain-containing protein n=1 Tax=Pseudonocardia sp. DSM 110487 TaxID=2865833 RepID=UPI001C6A244C|nr:DUF2283 domain-containing protein [Pseudonocardia sp. DSM 110487]QYN36782.1 DUF2283 domain-containing protein [Pseudonocardia sp. DSM 110487]